MTRARRRLAVLGTMALSTLLAGCIVVAAPRPVETRLPPGFDGQGVPSAAPTTPAPTASVETPGVDAAPTPSPSAAEALVCTNGGTQSVSGTERSYLLTGTCTEVTVAGSALTVDATAATIGTLRISGDRIRVQVADADEVIVQGNDGSVVSATAIGRLDISGDRTITEATAGIPSVTVRGNDNVVRSGGGVGSVVVEGSGNKIR